MAVDGVDAVEHRDDARDQQQEEEGGDEDQRARMPAGVAVAQVLTYIYQLDAYVAGQANEPERPEIEITDPEDGG